jgi:hypothetical protein
MIELTERLRPQAALMDAYFTSGVIDALPGDLRPSPVSRQAKATRRAWVKLLWNDLRKEWGLVRCNSPLLTPPSANMKLNKATTPSYGLTLQHHVQRINPKLVINACPNAGDCTKVCVLDNGNGAFHKVQIARRAKTAFLVEQPLAFAYMLGWELAKAQMRDGPILFRPNVNSDVAWEQLLPSMTEGHYLHHTVLYGYTKRPEVLDTNGWLGKAYRVAYSWNENSENAPVIHFLNRGGSVAMVTSRKKGAPVSPHLFNDAFTILDADVSDEWLFTEGAIGDLSAKGRARRLIGKSGFVVTT